ncbi:AI-2E family transporter [Clostridium sp. WILCCON 0269]|uniref:AI-2E family transporter n=1 Tax=Candidatus Clostridium eludens TaxID=3381663 RepID=A0ABW8SLG4_9CLOT
MSIEKKRKIKYLLVTIICIIIVVVILKVSVLKEMLYLMLISFLIAYTLKPIQQIMVNKGMSKKISALLLIGILILLIISIFAILIPSLFKERLSLNNAIRSIQNLIDNLYAKLKPIQGNKTIYMVTDNFNKKIDREVTLMFTKIVDFLMNIGQNILSIIVIPIITYYFLSEGKCINEKILSAFPVKSRIIIKDISCHADKILGRYIVSQLMLSGLVGIVTFFILIILNVDFPIILSIFNAFFNIIPYFGPVFGALPAVAIALIESPGKALWTAVCLYILQQIEGNILCPKVTGDSISMHPLVVILLLIIGGKIAGFIGMVLAVPLGVIFKVMYEDLNYYLF